ncbi:MAG: amidohydrolase family protein, partial [Gammaproteobacteria bacterium]|nr:amidohydrolase family protein [Gammaproteobacteria bacterium]
MTSILLKGGHVFTGENNAGSVADVLIEDQRITQIGANLQVDADQVIDCQGKWVTPGLLDIHTHLDLEVELAPGLGEVVRHGSTTVVMSNCSLGIAYGNQRENGTDPISDCFARVENIPKNVLRKVGDVTTWNDSGDYLDHFDQLNLGPNVVSMIPHSMLRIEVMGLEESLSRDPSEDELKQMEALVEKGMQEGYAGFSTDALPFHYLANQPNTRKQIPTQFANYGELKRLTNIIRNWDRVWQATPPKDSAAQVARNFLLSSGRLHGKPLKVTATAAMDFTVSRKVAILGKVLSRIINSRFFKGIFRFQALSAPFKT